MNNKLTVLVTGASGSVGYEVVKQLCHINKYQVVAFDVKTAKSKAMSKFFNDENFKMIYGDLTQNDTLGQLPIKIDYVIHLAAIIPPLANDNPKLAYQVNVNGTQHLINYIKTHSPKAFFMYSSSIAVYGDRIKAPYITIEDPITPSEGDDYARTKVEAENRIMRSGLEWCVFRLAAIMGAHKMSKLMFHQPLNTALEIATPRDTARAFVNALNYKPQLLNGIFNLGGGEACRMLYSEFLERSFNIYGLGTLDFPDRTFADKNFHCGYYKDGDVLEDIVYFRQDTIEDYFRNEAKKVSKLKKGIIKMFKTPIKTYLLKQSEPYKAYKNKDTEAMRYYF
ncbi:NAD(P)-dependent oxidoreductase [Lacinutrix sp. Hel_I_90]|uniref:NAD-dependent epimerase/dehydratase family protein n=1 Tax=Lacinutrix sp. Hel_I_90 TaxID=1249999 RepID=UPI0005C98EED|nr:NAD(P)-dependent oxidoreductase [Lacinutrix sp. Hel_I_90]